MHGSQLNLCILSKTSLSGRFAPILNFNCEHRKTKQKKFADLNIKLRGFSKF